MNGPDLSGLGRIAARRTGHNAALRCGVAVLALVLAVPSLAQVTPFRSLDGNGVDLVTGDLVFSFEEGSIGNGANRLSLLRRSGGQNASQWDGYRLSRAAGSQSVTITSDTTSEFWTYNVTNGTFSNGLADGSSLVRNGNEFLLTESDGSTIKFAAPSPEVAGSLNVCFTGNAAICMLPPTEFTSPNGLKTTLTYDVWKMWVLVPGQPFEDATADSRAWWRIKRISRTISTYFQFNYQDETTPLTSYSQPSTAWLTRSGAVFGNNLASVSYAYPEAGTTVVTDARGNPWRIAGGGYIFGFRRPGATSDSFSLSRPDGNSILVTNEGLTTSYSRIVSGGTITMTVSHPGGGQTLVVANSSVGRPASVTDQLGRQTSYTYDGNLRLTRVTGPEGNYTEYTLDSRGNATTVLQAAKPGSGAANIVTTASYPVSCTNFRTCNQPDWTRDAKGNQTDYTYDPTHGGVLTVTSPAAVTNGVRPQVRYTYTPVNGVPLLSAVSTCRSGSSCVGTADETRVTVSYNNDLLTVTTTEMAGDASLSRSITRTYDGLGNVLTIDGPLAGTGDTVRYRYNATRDVVGVVGPDPDGAGPLVPQAQRTSYNVDRQVTLVEQGTVADQSDTAWAAFSSARQIATSYDSNARKVADRAQSGGTTFALTQYSYDARGRLDCQTQRMNPAQFATPAAACTLGPEGSFGPDRITKTNYDLADQVTSVVSAFGTADAATDVAVTYTPSGKQTTLTDGNNNRSTFVYDGHNRLSQMQYPSPTTPNTSNTSDYVQLTYDANGNVTQRRLRDGQLITYAYDALDRVTTMTPPSPLTAVNYSYDLQGRVTQANRPADGMNVTMSYDALGRKISDSQTYGGMTYQYDLADRRTRATWSDGFYVTYDRRVTGELAAVRENGAASGAGVLATYAYNSLGERTGITRGNGGTSSFAYDAVGRLASLSHDLAGTANDVATTFSYTPSSQIASLSRNNTVYAWTQALNVDRPYSINGLNQMTSSGATSLGYDSRGNLTASGITTYAYDAFNRLRSSNNGMSANYDPLGRLSDLSLASATRFFHDGQQMAAEPDVTGAIQRRYVWGDGADELITWYEGAGTTNRRWAVSDERGSVVAYADSANTAIAINRYDEYGIPQSGNIGRFQYTGQAWLPEIGMYYYKARVYSPTLGRFLQTDPIGYGDGMNIYAYVGNDPINGADPSGTVVEFGDGWFVRQDQGGNSDPECPGPFCPTAWRPRFLGFSDGSPSVPNGERNEPRAEATLSQQNNSTPLLCATQIANSITDLAKFGVTGRPLGLPPYGIQGKTVTSTFYGTVGKMFDYFGFISGKAADRNLIPNPFAPGVRSVPSGITLRYSPSANDFRIDVPIGALGSPSDGFLNRPESLHRNGNQCPMKPSPN